MIVAVSCCNLFLVARVFRFTLTLCAEFVFPVACVRFSFHVWHLLQRLFLVARISQLNCYAFLVSLGICCVSVSVALPVSRFAFRMSCA